MKKVSLLTLLLILLIFLAGCDNGSAPDSGVSKSSELVNVCLSIEGNSSEMQKTSSLNGLSFTYQFKAVPQWCSDNIHGTTSEWTTINYSENMSLGYFTPGQWIFFIRMLGGSIPVYEGHSDVISISSSQAATVTVSVTKILQDAEWGAVRINITAPTVDENTDSLTISWGNDPEDSAVADKSPAGSMTTFSKTIKGLSAGDYTFTLTYNNSETRNESITVADHQMTLITGQFDGSGWDLEKTTLQFHDINIVRYDHHQGAGNPIYYGTVDIDVDSAVPGERVYFSPRPVATSSVDTLTVTSNGQPVATLTGDTDLYSFIMPEQDVTINIKFTEGHPTGVIDVMIFKAIVKAYYAENHNSVRHFGRSDHAPGAGDRPATLGDIKIWYDSSANKVCWHSDYEKMQLSAGSMAEFFMDCDRYESISLNGIIASDVTDMSSMFQGCTSLTEVDLAKFNASGSTSLAGMFQDCTNLTTVTLTGFTPNTTSGVNMANMFNGCRTLASLDITKFNGTSATNMEGMFKDCELLSNQLNFTNIVTSNSTSMASMFQGCKKLRVKLTNFSTASATSLASMFQGCTGISSLDVSTFNVHSATDMSSMFENCTSLKTLTLPTLAGATTNVSMAGLLKGCKNLQTLNGLAAFDTSKVTDMSSMFEGCSKLPTAQLNLANFNTSSATNMAGMFKDCIALTSLDLSNFNTSNVTNMAGMFKSCKKLEATLDLSTFNTSSVTDMSYMFFGCVALTGITFDTDDFDTSNVTDMSYMFAATDLHDGKTYMELANLNVSGFNTANVTNMSHMFYMCYQLASTNVSGFRTPKVTDMSYMFAGYSGHASKWTNIDMREWVFTYVTSTESMFDRCESLCDGLLFPGEDPDHPNDPVDPLKATNFASLTTMRFMFSQCKSLTPAKLGHIVSTWQFSGQGANWETDVYGNSNTSFFGRYGQDAETAPNYIIRTTMLKDGSYHNFEASNIVYTTKDNKTLYIGGKNSTANCYLTVKPGTRS